MHWSAFHGVLSKREYTLGMKAMILFFVLLLSLQARELDDIISKALEKNYSLEAINERIAANRENIEVSEQFPNPELLILTNTVNDKEPMAQDSVTIKQKLPYFGKRDASKQVALAQKDVLNESLDNTRVKLVYMIRSKAYKIWELERSYRIICDYEDLTKHNIDLYESYTSTSENQHMGIMSAELALSDLRIQKSVLLSKISSEYAQLSYLSAQEISSLELILEMGAMPGRNELSRGLEGNRDVSLKEKELQRELRRSERVDMDNYPDISLVAGYSHRERFDDFTTFGLGLSLPIYGSEDRRYEETRRTALAAQALKEDTRQEVTAAFQEAYAQMKSAYETYHIINDQALPQVEHMFDLINASVSAGGDLFKYIDILVQKLRLEQKSISAVADYNRADAKIRALSGEIQ